jgi:hypothetical protein
MRTFMEMNMTTKSDCDTGVCGRCKHWLMKDQYLKGICKKYEYIISCSHDCCVDYENREK